MTNENQSTAFLDDNFEAELAKAEAMFDLLTGDAPSPKSAPTPKPLSRNEVELAIRFVTDNLDRIRFVRELNQRITWDSTRWMRDPSGANIMNQLFRYIARLHKSDNPADHKLASSLNTPAILKRVIETAKSDFRVLEPITSLDCGNTLLNLQNGILDLSTGDLYRHDPEQFLSRVADISYDPDATCPRWLAFIKDITSGNESLATYLQDISGYILTGMSNEQIFFYLQGSGANGKSTFLAPLISILGGYVEHIPQTLLTTERTELSTLIAQTHGARLILTPELPEKAILSDQRLKVLTGTDPACAAFRNQLPFTTIVTGKIVLQGNHPPKLRGTDHGIWRRLHLIPFLNQFNGTNRDTSLLADLANELPGILNWAVQGAQRVLTSPLQVPEIVENATASLRISLDPLQTFFEQETEIAPCERIELSDLYERYRAWAASNEIKPQGKIQFSQALTHRGLTQFRTKDARYWNGIRLRHPQQNQQPTLAA